jgi:hypothetical protein
LPFSTITERPGSLSGVGWGKETVFGTSVATASFLPSTSCTLEADPGWFSPQLMMATRDLQVFNMYGEQKFTGNIEGPLFPSMGIQLLAGAIGTDVVSGTVAPYTHTISEANTLPSFTVEKIVGGYQSQQFVGCRIGKYTLKCTAGNEPVTITADMTGRAANVLDTPTAESVTNEIPFVFAEATLTLASNTRAEAKNIQIDINNGLKETYTFGGHGPNFITPVTLKVSGSFDVVWDSFDDATYGDWTKMMNGTLAALTLQLQHPSNAGTVTFTLPQVALSKHKTDLKVADTVLSTVNFEASKPLTGGSQYTLQAVVSNSISAAY